MIEPSRKSRLFDGIMAMAPILLGVLPFSMISGITSVEIGLSPLQSMGMSIVVFAGAAQLAAYQLMGSGAASWVVVFTVWMINMRFSLYSASLGLHFKNLPVRWKFPLAYVLSDQAYAVSIMDFETNARLPLKHWFYLGAGLALWLTWQVGTMLGVLLGASVPSGLSLDFAIPLTFLVVMMPTLKDAPAFVAALVGGCVAVAASSLPYNLGLLLAVFTGIAAGMAVESWNK